MVQVVIRLSNSRILGAVGAEGVGRPPHTAPSTSLSIPPSQTFYITQKKQRIAFIKYISGLQGIRFINFYGLG